MRDKIRVLLVEDDEDDYVLIHHLLSEIPTEDFALDWTPGYEDARDALSKDEHDICLLDYRLGGHDGMEILDEAFAKGWQTPIIFLTGRGAYEIDVRAMRAGAADYLVKDQMNPSLLERSIRYALERKRGREALQRANEALEKMVQVRTADLEAAYADLAKTSEKIKFFAYSISHDLKSPAYSLYGLAKRLRENYAGLLDEKGEAYCDRIVSASEHIASLVDKINQFIAAKEAPLKIELLDLKNILRLIKEEFSEQLRLRKIKWKESAGLPPLRADRVSMIRIFRNLVDNALKYGGEDLSRIEIGYKKVPGFYVFSVKDDGVGIKAEEVKGIVTPFERKGGAKDVEGTGLGLAIVSEIAELHRGEVWAELGPLKGTAVFFSISDAL